MLVAIPSVLNAEQVRSARAAIEAGEWRDGRVTAGVQSALAKHNLQLHRVEPVTRGARLASFFWVESMVRDDGQRTLLLDMDAAVRTLAQEVGDDHRAVVSLTGTYHNLLRRWADA